MEIASAIPIFKLRKIEIYNWAAQAEITQEYYLKLKA